MSKVINDEAHPVLVISDTHGTLRPEVLEQAAGCEAILHAGDVDSPEVLKQLKEIAPVYVVRGNVDGAWAADLPEELELELFGFRIYMIHNKKQGKKDLSGIDIMVYGHSHEYQDVWEKDNGIRYLNPGSCGPKRFRLPVTMMKLTLYPEEHRSEVIRLDCESLEAGGRSGKSFGASGINGATQGADGRSGKSPEAVDTKEAFWKAGRSRASSGIDELSEKGLYQLVKKVMKGMRAGKSIPDMARRYHADERLVEDICRMYATHPGIDIDGIMDRLERRGL